MQTDENSIIEARILHHSNSCTMYIVHSALICSKIHVYDVTLWLSAAMNSSTLPGLHLI